MMGGWEEPLRSRLVKMNVHSETINHQIQTFKAAFPTNKSFQKGTEIDFVIKANGDIVIWENHVPVLIFSNAKSLGNAFLALYLGQPNRSEKIHQKFLNGLSEWLNKM
jgi:hypothetical protein